MTVVARGPSHGMDAGCSSLGTIAEMMLLLTRSLPCIYRLCKCSRAVVHRIRTRSWFIREWSLGKYFFRSFWACVSVWPFRIWYIYIKQLSTELPEEASGGVRTRGTTLGDPRHIHKAMKTLITIKLALKSLEPDYFHFSSIFQTRRLGFGLTWSFSQLGFLQVYVPFLFMISIFLHVLVMFSGLLSLWLPAAPGDISKPMNVLRHACWATVVSPGHLPPRLLQEHPLWFPLFRPCLPEVCFQSSSLRDPIETGLRSCHFPALRKA